jgi:hypothetical protein
MKRILLTLILVSIASMAVVRAALTPGHEYFIILSIYDKVLGSNSDGTKPSLSAFSAANAQDFVFVAEEAPTDGYVLLRQKSTGRYLAASTSNSYDVVFQGTKGTSNAYQWRTEEGLDQYVVCKHKTSKCLGIDGGKSGSDYVGVYYDKNRGSHALFHVVPAVDDNLTETLRNYESPDYTSAIGTQAVDYYQVYNRTIERDDAVDIHVRAASNTVTGTSSRISLNSLSTWLIFDNVTPSDVISKYLRYVRINGSAASNGSNCRVAIYLNGAAVIPLRAGSLLSPMTVYTEPNCEGTSYNVTSGNHSSLSTRNNTTRSFVLRRGFMATVATGTQGGGYSRVYVADHHDVVVNELPAALDRRISSIHIRPWQYVSKKGWCSTTGQGSNETECRKVRATWFYTWSADRKSTDNLEYIPIRQHIYWPSMSTINGYESTAALSINEPEHSEQHNNCDCGGAVNAWTACTKTPDFLSSGARIGSPSPTDASWLTEYIGHVDDMAYRCDFVSFHAYWGTNEAATAQDWYNRLKSIYNNTHRPIWITEWNNGASWTSESWPSDYNAKLEKNRKAIQDIVEMLDTCSFVERYAIYNWDTYYRAMINWDDGNVLPAGQVYRDNRSTFAYNASVQKVPNWWAPSVKAPSFEMSVNESQQTATFTITNPNGDMTESLVVQRLNESGEWETVAEITDRWRFDGTTLKISNVKTTGFNVNADSFRVVVTTLRGETAYSSTSFGLLVNPTIETSSKSNVEGWNCAKDASNGFTKATGDTYFEVWDATAANINFNYSQQLTELEPGIYSLSANVFNTVDNVASATVNGAVGLYAQTAQQLYFAPVTTDAALASDATSIPAETLLKIDRIIVTDGTLRVGIRNLGTMSARWAGGDNFLLHKIGDLADADLDREYAAADLALYDLMPEVEGGWDASRFIVNPDCNRQNSYGWETSNMSVKADAESYDGNTANPYWNLWKSGAYTSSMTQQIDGLPEGTYTFSALVRGQNSATMTLSATVGEASVSESVQGGGADAIAGSGYPNGWQRITTPAFTVAHGQSLTIAFNMTASGTAWWSADHFALTLTEIPDSRTGIQDTPTEVLANGTSVNGKCYDLSGRHLDATKPLRRGLYIINGKKVIIK